MRSNWKQVKLGEVCEITMGQSPKGEDCNDEGIGMPLLNGPTEFGISYPTPVQWTTVSKKECVEEDLLFCVRGSTTGRMNWANQKYCIGRGLASIRHKQGSQYKHFIKGIIDVKLKDILCSATGSTFPNIGKDLLNNLEISVPPLETQKQIAKILSSIDDKIELNNKINDNLEKQAQAIYSDMFANNNKNNILSDIANITMGQSPAGSSYNETGDGTVFYQGRAEFNSRFPKRRLFTTEPKRMAEENDILMSVRAPVGDINIAHECCCIGRGLSAIHSKTGHSSFLLYTMLSSKKELDVYNGEGTVFGSINREALNNLPIFLPNTDLIQKFEDIVSSMDNIIRVNSDEIERLSQLRDTLLPKLMSGEIDASQVEV